MEGVSFEVDNFRSVQALQPRGQHGRTVIISLGHLSLLRFLGIILPSVEAESTRRENGPRQCSGFTQWGYPASCRAEKGG